MSIIYKEFTNDSDISQCVSLQSEIFGLQDVDIISSQVLKLFIKERTKIGIAVGAYDTDDEKMIGFILGFRMTPEDSIYTVMLGVKKEHDNKSYGYKLMMKYREYALAQNIVSTYCSFEPLSTNLARLYMGIDGFTGVEYITDNNSNAYPKDKLLAKWDFKHQNSSVNSFSNDKLKEIQIVNDSNRVDSNQLLIEIPDNYSVFLEQDVALALHLRMSMRKMLNYYVNDNKYKVSGCYKLKIQDERKCYYLLEKQ